MAAAKANGNGNGNAAAAPVTVFVSGGTSNTGSATITALLRDHPNVTVRAGVRDPKKAAEKFPSADAKRLSFVVHDVKNAHLTAAQTDAADAAELKGVDALLLVPPQSFQDRRGVPTAYIRAAKAAGVKHIVLISTTASVRPDLYLTGPFKAIEEEVAASGVPYSFLRTGSFFENHWGNKDTVAPVDGSAAFYAPIAADALIAAIAVADIGEAAANALVRAGASKAYNLGGTAVTHNELAAAYSRVLNKPVKFVSVPDEGLVAALAKHGWPEASAKGLAALYRYYEAEYNAVKAKGAAAVAAYYSTADLSGLLNGGRAPTTFGQWLVASGAAFAFGGVKQHVFVAGAAGNTGAATVKSLLRDHPHVSIRAGVRDAKKAEGVFAAEFADPKLHAKERLTFAVHDVKNAHLTAAQSDAADAAELKGVDALVLAPPAIPTERVGVATAYARASKAAGVKHILIITTPGAVLPLALTKSLGEAEQQFVASGVPYTLLRPVFFYTNYQLTADSIRPAGGSAWYIPAAADKPIFHIAIEDVGEAAANATTYGSDPKAQHYGKAHALASHNLTGAQAAEAFSRALGRKVSYVAVTDEQTVKALTAKGLPEFVAKGLVELYRTAETGAWGNGDAAVASLKALLNEQRNPTSLDAFVTANAKLFA